EIAFQLVADQILRRLGIPLEHLVRGQDHPGRAEATLEPVLLPEPLLDRMQLAVLGQPFDRHDLGAVALDGEERARLHRLTVHDDGARAALARVATDVGAGEPDVLADVVDEQEAGLHLVTDRLAVDRHLHWQFHVSPPASSECSDREGSSRARQSVRRRPTPVNGRPVAARMRGNAGVGRAAATKIARRGFVRAGGDPAPARMLLHPDALPRLGQALGSAWEAFSGSVRQMLRDSAARAVRAATISPVSARRTASDIGSPVPATRDTRTSATDATEVVIGNSRSSGVPITEPSLIGGFRTPARQAAVQPADRKT